MSLADGTAGFPAINPLRDSTYGTFPPDVPPCRRWRMAFRLACATVPGGQNARRNGTPPQRAVCQFDPASGSHAGAATFSANPACEPTTAQPPRFDPALVLLNISLCPLRSISTSSFGPHRFWLRAEHSRFVAGSFQLSTIIRSSPCHDQSPTCFFLWTLYNVHYGLIYLHSLTAFHLHPRFHHPLSVGHHGRNTMLELLACWTDRKLTTLPHTLCQSLGFESRH